VPTTTVEDLRIQERVARGVAWLDEHVRGWWLPDREPAIDLDELVMGSACGCILGQLWDGEYYKAPIHMDTAVEAGFDTILTVDFEQRVRLTAKQIRALSDAEFEALTVEWTRVILELRAGTPT
jgi:hypothetical protein